MKNIPAIILLNLNVAKARRFYRFSYYEETVINGRTSRNEVSKLFHISMERTANDLDVHIEVFERAHKNRDLSSSEKEFYSQVASISDDLQFTIKADTSFVRLRNGEALKKKMQEKADKLGRTYKGESAEKTYRFLHRFYNSGALIKNDLTNYNQYGLLLNRFYGKYTDGMAKRSNARYTNLMPDTLAEVEEIISPEILSATEATSLVKLSGVMHTINVDMFRRAMKVNEIPFDPERDRPELKRYEGDFTFNNFTGETLHVGVFIDFSFGENYKRSIEYKLKEVPHEEV